MIFIIKNKTILTQADFSRWVSILVIDHLSCIFGCFVADSWFKGGTSAGIWNYGKGSSSVWPAGARRGPKREQGGCDSPAAGDHWDRECSKSGCQRCHGETQILIIWYVFNLFDSKGPQCQYPTALQDISGASAVMTKLLILKLLFMETESSDTLK